MNFNLRITLFRALVQPKLEYGAQLWAPELTVNQRDRIDKIMTKFAATAMQLPPGANSAFIAGKLNIAPVTTHCDELAIRYFGRLATISTDRLVGRVFRTRLAEAQRKVHAHARTAGTALSCRSWCVRMHDVMTRYGLSDFWDDSARIRVHCSPPDENEPSAPTVEADSISVKDRERWTDHVRSAVRQRWISEWRAEIAES